MNHARRWKLSPAQRADMWGGWKAGQSLHEIGRALGKDTATVVAALSQQVRQLPATLRRSLTWDRGLEMQGGGVDFESTRHVRLPSRGKAACSASRRPLQRVRGFVSAVDVGAGRTSYRAIIPASIWSSRWQ